MKWYFYFLVFLVLSCSRGRQVVITEEDVGADILYAKDTYRPFSGKCIVYYNNSDAVKEQFTFRKGILNGETTSWYKNGNLKRKGSYNKGHICGKWTYWDEKGNKFLEASYKQDSLHGAYQMLYANGNIKEKGQFSRNRRTGEWLYYDESGRQVK